MQYSTQVLYCETLKSEAYTQRQTVLQLKSANYFFNCHDGVHGGGTGKKKKKKILKKEPRRVHTGHQSWNLSCKT